jgi:hypothetical protein
MKLKKLNRENQKIPSAQRFVVYRPILTLAVVSLLLFSSDGFSSSPPKERRSSVESDSGLSLTSPGSPVNGDVHTFLDALQRLGESSPLSSGIAASKGSGFLDEHRDQENQYVDRDDIKRLLRNYLSRIQDLRLAHQEAAADFETQDRELKSLDASLDREHPSEGFEFNIKEFKRTSKSGQKELKLKPTGVKAFVNRILIRNPQGDRAKAEKARKVFKNLVRNQGKIKFRVKHLEEERDLYRNRISQILESIENDEDKALLLKELLTELYSSQPDLFKDSPSLSQLRDQYASPVWPSVSKRYRPSSDGLDRCVSDASSVSSSFDFLSQSVRDVTGTYLGAGEVAPLGDDAASLVQQGAVRRRRGSESPGARTYSLEQAAPFGRSAPVQRNWQNPGLLGIEGGTKHPHDDHSRSDATHSPSLSRGEIGSPLPPFMNRSSFVGQRASKDDLQEGADRVGGRNARFPTQEREEDSFPSSRAQPAQPPGLDPDSRGRRSFTPRASYPRHLSSSADSQSSLRRRSFESSLSGSSVGNSEEQPLSFDNPYFGLGPDARDEGSLPRSPTQRVSRRVQSSGSDLASRGQHGLPPPQMLNPRHLRPSDGSNSRFSDLETGTLAESTPSEADNSSDQESRLSDVSGGDSEDPSFSADGDGDSSQLGRKFNRRLKRSVSESSSEDSNETRSQVEVGTSGRDDASEVSSVHSFDPESSAGSQREGDWLSSDDDSKPAKRSPLQTFWGALKRVFTWSPSKKGKYRVTDHSGEGRPFLSLEGGGDEEDSWLSGDEQGKKPSAKKETGVGEQASSSRVPYQRLENEDFYIPIESQKSIRLSPFQKLRRLFKRKPYQRSGSEAELLIPVSEEDALSDISSVAGESEDQAAVGDHVSLRGGSAVSAEMNPTPSGKLQFEKLKKLEEELFVLRPQGKGKGKPIIQGIDAIAIYFAKELEKAKNLEGEQTSNNTSAEWVKNLKSNGGKWFSEGVEVKRLYRSNQVKGGMTPAEKTKLHEQWMSSDQKLLDMTKALLQYENLVKAQQAHPEYSHELQGARESIRAYLKSFGSDPRTRERNKQSAEDYYNRLKGDGKTQ